MGLPKQLTNTTLIYTSKYLLLIADINKLLLEMTAINKTLTTCTAILITIDSRSTIRGN